MKKIISLYSFLLVSIVFVNAQGNLKFTFENGQVTNDGSNFFYEVDVMVETNNGQADLKIGSGQTFFNYNTAAFGTNIGVEYNNTSNNNPVFVFDGTLIGQDIDAAAGAKMYSVVVNDNTDSRVSLAFYQNFAAHTIAANNITATPTKLVHLKILFVDENQQPNVAFENDESIINSVNDQYFTACGAASTANPFQSADCTNYNGIQFFDVVYDNTNPTLGIEDETIESDLSFYPNPIPVGSNQMNINWKKNNENAVLDIFDTRGRLINNKEITLNAGVNIIDLPSMETGVYLFRFSFENQTTPITKQIIIK